MSHRIVAELAQVSRALDGAIATAQASDALRARAAEINANLGKSSHRLDSSNARIAAALARMQDSGTELRVAEARLAFQGARLKRSSKAIQSSLTRLKNAGTMLEERAREARAVAETADRTATLITAIEAAAARGESFDHLLGAANQIAEATSLRRRTN